MSRISIRQFRAALADPADESTSTRAYRRLARLPAAIGGSVGVEWVTWPPAAAARDFADWPIWEGSAAQQQSAAPRRAFADWPVWNDARRQPAAAVA